MLYDEEQLVNDHSLLDGTWTQLGKGDWRDLVEPYVA